ncbi:T9SS type B sorting domain-containing protein [Muricauda sp. JGD-17]|uniref:T9SS type B sorting domain-containing protein n=1 Tax=Flagellimonas ochracea TaxID=2696472 RepID=A0A964TB87_9FLAO|nr:T9SS type B sorting domain-containing protein [Allomuricauda ochracea]NAY91684.1 T9SS type B sorting domain-containing protein [Allomuricauda ochracea]
MTKHIVKSALFLAIGLVSHALFSQEYNSFDIRYQDNIKGDLTFIANNIVNRDGGTGSTEPEDSYNATGSSSTYNDWLNMQYVDVDSDPTTFSSSRATFTFPQTNCNLIRYAGLYWSGTYPSEQAGQAVGTNRQNDFNQVKFMVPGGSYVDITADEIIYDGFTSGDSSMRRNSPYACYADVTTLVSALANPTGDYTIANVRAVTGSLSPGGGASAGWTLIIVYENPTLTGKLITTFDGFARVNSANPSVDINYSGFNTIPAGPVNANIGVAALEGDNRITGDRVRIRAASSGSFTTISNATNPSDNFFNSNITLNGVVTTNRDVNSVNTLGYDTDMFLLNNPLNSVIPNSETAATFRFTSSGDQYYPFFNSFNVEIIEPEIVLEKRVEDIAGNDITGAGVNLGQYLDYVLSFENTGNDDATNYTIRDVLPINTTLDETALTLPAGVTYVYNAPTREITFTIPDNLVEEGDPVSEIRMRVQVAENCFDFIDACTDQIQNLAYSTYQGVINNNQITDDPSVSDFDNCGFTTPGATNFLLDDLESCDFTRTVQLCGDDVLLDAGDNFDAYTWYRDENGNGQIDLGTDTVINDGDPDGDPSTLLVTDIGTYIVDKEVADPCKGFQEIIIVELFGAIQSNPISALINDTTNTVDGEIVVCPNDGSELPEIFLCGLNDTELIQVNIPDALSIEWQQLDEASCAAATPDCANTNNSCTWNTVDTGNDFTASDAGEYRLVINYQDGCFTRFYFNIFKNPLDPQYTTRDIVCDTDGNITVTNMPLDYEYQLIDQATGNVVVAYNPSPSFDIADNGSYRVEMRQQGVTDGCIFILENIGILERNFQVDITTTDTDCNGFGTISISALNVFPQYYYEISQGGTIVDTFGPSNDNNYTFENLNDGVYDVSVRTDDNCTYTEQVTIQDLNNLELNARVSQHITCREGNIQMESTGGQTPHTYAIWSYVDEGGNTVISYPTVDDIPSSAYQTSVIFDILDPGDYTFVVVDRNNCHDISNTVTIEFRPAADFNATSVIDVLCYGDSTGAINFNLVSSNGYQLTYYLFDATGFDENNYDLNNALATNSSGNFTGLPSGDYVVVINQRKGSAACDYFEYHTISAPSNPLDADAVLVQDYTCLQNGIVEAQNITGGTAPYEYSIDGVNFGVSPTFSNLTDGTYTITVRDDNGCTFPTNTITLDPLNPPSDLTFVATAPNCPALTSDVTATVVDGNAPFVFEIIAPATTAATSITGASANFDGLAPGTYTFRVTDDKGCVYDESFTIDPVTQINVTGQLVSNITCFNDTDGELLFTITDFNTDYDYTVSGPANFSGSNESSGTVSLTGLDDGTYTITVTDNLTNCTDTASVTINAPPSMLTINATETQPTCVSDGSVTLTSSGGWGGNSFTLTNPDTTLFGTNSTGVFTGLTQTGTYTASVTDTNGCVVTTTFDLNAAIAPVLDIVPSDLCYDDAVGLTLTANVTSGGDGNYEYSLNGGPFGASNIFSGLTPGTHTIDVRDGNNCTDTASITINPELSVIASAPNITACGTDTDITITAAGGDGNYVYAVVGDGVAPVGGDFSITNPVTVTGAGDYDVYVRDNAGAAGFCEASYDITIIQDVPLAIAPTVTDVTCFGGSDGAITLSASGGEGPYLFSIDNGSTYQTSNSFVNLGAGSYDVRIRDANNCEATLTVVVNQPNQLVAEALQTQAYTCLQLGEITVGSITPTSGGSGDYQYNINGGPWTTSTTGGTVFTGLMNGTYTIQVRDANQIDCFITLSDVIIAPLPTEPTLSTSITYNCDGTGDITVLPNDPSYTYSLNGGAPQAGNMFANVAVGTHTIDVDYGSGCVTQTTVVLEPGNSFGSTVTAFSDITCNGGADGSITFEVENFEPGTGFTYQVDAGPVSAAQFASPITINGLTAGNYSITVIDLRDPTCSIILNQTLAEPAALIASASITSVATCTNGGATITASASGGTPSYEFQLEDGVGGIIAGFDYVTNGNNTVFAGLAAGDYVIRARDTNLCEDPIDAVLTVIPAATITFTTTPTACYSGNNDGTIQVDVTAGNGDYQFSLNGGPWITPTPTTATTHTFASLTSGNYTINVRDGFGCVGTLQNVTINDDLVASVDVVDVSTCADGSISVTASGGTPVLEYAFVPTTTDPTGLFSTTSTFTITAGNEGDYDIYVRDNSATVPFCEYMETVTVNPATPLNITATPTDPLCHDGTGSILVDITSGIAPYTIQIIDLDNGGASDQTDTNVLNTSRTYFNLMPGDYTINVTDATGCVVTETPVTLNNPDELTASIIGITPATCTGDPNDFGFGFSGYPTTLGTIEFSADGGTTWIGNNSVPGTTDQFTGYNSGDTVYPSMRTVDGFGNTVCQTNLPPFIIPYPLDDLDITILPIVVNCNELQVTVRGQNGTAPYEYTYSDDPANFDPATATWTAPLPLGTTHTFVGLVPGRSYTFYVRDAAGCVRQSNVNVNDIITVPLEITSSITPSCAGASNGSITYTVTDNQAPFETQFRWDFYDMSSGSAVLVTSSGGIVPYSSPQDIVIGGLPAGNYFIEVVEVDGGGVDSCVGATENELLIELDPLSGTPVVLQNISCNAPGLIQVQNPLGGGGVYTYTVTGPAPFVTITSTSDNPIEIPANSPAGNYDVTMEDQYGCSVNLGTVPLTLTPNPTVDSIVVNNCSTPISVTINATSVAAQIFYSIDGGVTYLDNGGIFNNVAPGSYNVSIIDGNGCTDTDTFDVYPILEFTAIQTVALDCEPGAAANAEIEIDVISGSGNYEFIIDGPGANDQARTVLPTNPFTWTGAAAAGSYEVIVFDIGTAPPNCSQTITIDVPDAPLPSFTETHTDITCNGANDGSITLTEVDTGVGPLNYTLTPMPGGAVLNGNTFENLPAGTYSVRGAGTNSCFTDIFNIQIAEPNPVVVPAPTVVEFGCVSGNNTNNASITVDTASITGGSGTYVIYEFINDQSTPATGDDIVVQTGPNNVYIETDINGGSYTINVYDENGCVGTTNVAIAPFDSLDAANIVVDAIATCVAGEDITITAVGSITNSTTHPANYEFRELPSGVFQASGSFTGLSVGTHNFEVRNTITGCVITIPHEVADPEVLDLIVVGTTNITCFGDTDGAVDLNLVDASVVAYPSATSYTLYYDINNTPGNLADDVTSSGSDADGSFTISGLAAGAYYIEVTDTNPPGAACVYIESFNIAGPSASIAGSTVVTEITCVGNDGAIQITNVTGGWGGYSYYVGTSAPTGPSDYVVGDSFAGLPVGTYEAWVIDSSGCEQLVDTVSLSDPLPITASIQINQENCTDLQGEIEVLGTAGGQGSNYTYQLIRNGSNIGSPQTNTVFSGLGAGSYEVMIADQWSCTTTVGPVVLTNAMTATTTVVKPIDCTLDSGGHVTVSVSGGSSNLTFDVVFPDGFTTASNATGVFTGLTQPGVYTFTVTDNNTTTPCTFVITQELDDKVDPIIDDVLMDPVSCNGGADGNLTVVLDPTTIVDPVYTYELYEASNLVTPYRFAQTTPTFDNLPAGDYRVRVISSRACDDFYDATVTEPVVLSASASATTFVCNPNNTVNTSTITVTGGGGTGPYLYSLDNTNFQSANTFDVVDTGVDQNITVYVEDANGCTTTAAVFIPTINTFTVGITQNAAISCANPEEVLLTVSDDGNPANTYTFELLPLGNPNGSLTATLTNTTATFELIAPGNYTFRVTDDATGCYVDTTHNIAPYDLIDVVATATAPAVCFGDAGTLEINVTGYSGTYDYEVFLSDGSVTGITGSANTSTNPLSITDPALIGGNYFVRVTETANPLCVEDSNVITIVSPSSALVVTPQEVANVTCSNDQGEIVVAPTGGYAPYDIVLTNTTTSQVYTVNDVPSYLFTGLSAGTFDVQITDDNGCVINEPIVLVQPIPITADINATPTTLLCYGDTNASVWAENEAGGEGVYDYQLNIYDPTGTTIVFTSGEQSSPTFNNLGAGIYSITVSDNWNCDVETIQVTISEPTDVMASLIELSAMTCINQAQLQLDASGGTAPYEYSVDGTNYFAMSGGSTHIFNVGAGIYQYYVRDAFGCEAQISNQVSVDMVPPLTIDIDDSAAMINCTGEASATIVANTTGGLGNYSYELFGDAALTNLIAGPQTNDTFSGLVAGSYYVRVTSQDCVEVSPEIIITDPAPLQVDREEFTNVTCSGLNDGTITVEVSGGTGEIFYAITPNLNQFDTVNVFEDLAPGIYDVIAQDRNGCFMTFQFEIEQPEPIQAEAINIMHEVCFNSADGSFELQITGGTAPYETALNSNADADYVQDQILFQNLPAGTHVVFVRDSQGCETNVFVEIEPGVNLEATVTPMYECTGNIPENYLNIVFTDPSVSADVLYALDSTDPGDMQLSDDFRNMAPGDHYITIAHANGCMVTYDFTIEGYEPLTLILENNNINEITAVAEGGLEDYTFYFGDVDNGTDNTFYINRTDTYTVTVVDQNGCEVQAEIFMEFIDIEIPNFFTPDGDGLNDMWLPNNLETFPNVLMIVFDRYGRELYRMEYGDSGWDGIYNNKELPTGDYWYIVKLQGENDDREFIGHFTLYRD